MADDFAYRLDEGGGYIHGGGGYIDRRTIADFESGSISDWANQSGRFHARRDTRAQQGQWILRFEPDGGIGTNAATTLHEEYIEDPPTYGDTVGCFIHWPNRVNHGGLMFGVESDPTNMYPNSFSFEIRGDDRRMRLWYATPGNIDDTIDTTTISTTGLANSWVRMEVDIGDPTIRAEASIVGGRDIGVCEGDYQSPPPGDEIGWGVGARATRRVESDAPDDMMFDLFYQL